jgi:hypothetical protein
MVIGGQDIARGIAHHFGVSLPRDDDFMTIVTAIILLMVLRWLERR